MHYQHPGKARPGPQPQDPIRRDWYGVTLNPGETFQTLDGKHYTVRPDGSVRRRFPFEAPRP